MAEIDKVLSNLPPHGYINELAKQCGCSRKTVSRALFKGQLGPKSDMVRAMYHKLYASNTKNLP